MSPKSNASNHIGDFAIRYARDCPEDITAVATILLDAFESHMDPGFIAISFPLMTLEEKINVMKRVVCNFDVRSTDGRNLPPVCVWKGYLLAVSESGEIMAGVKPFVTTEHELFDTCFQSIRLAVVDIYGEEKSKIHLETFDKVLAAFGVAGKYIKEPEEAEYHIEAVATFPKFKRRGVSNSLMRHAFSLGREKGFTEAHISAWSDNIPAIRSYEKVGYKKMATIIAPALAEALNAEGGITMMTADISKA